MVFHRFTFHHHHTTVMFYTHTLHTAAVLLGIVCNGPVWRRSYTYSSINTACIPALQEGLVSLLDEQSEEDECTPYVRMETNSGESLLKVERVWHRVIGHRLVFGALLAPTNQM